MLGSHTVQSDALPLCQCYMYCCAIEGLETDAAMVLQFQLSSRQADLLTESDMIATLHQPARQNGSHHQLVIDLGRDTMILKVIIPCIALSVCNVDISVIKLELSPQSCTKWFFLVFNGFKYKYFHIVIVVTFQIDFCIFNTHLPSVLSSLIYLWQSTCCFC